jgi:NAD(P) transhydrogenase subunit alpha
MDALSSQATAAGYSAALMAAAESPKLVPMLVTAAGTVRPARVLVLGVGVAGLQAIATARRLGAVVHAYDLRPETREQVESLGAKFVEAPTQEADEGGYATEVDRDTAQRQQQILEQYVADANVVITTAQVPGRRAPVLVTHAMLQRMQTGSVVIDMAAASGGNVEGTVADEEVRVDGARVFGPTDLASRVATDASRMYSRNLQELVGRMRGDDGDDDGFAVRLDDEVVGPSTIVHNGTVVHPRTREVMELPVDAVVVSEGTG